MTPDDLRGYIKFANRYMKKSEINKAIDLLESLIKNPEEGLPEEIFIFVTRITPMINVDLLIKNEQNQTLLTWREDKLYGSGWHIPGGIIRYKEKSADRIMAVAKGELGAKVEFKKDPLIINEIMLLPKDRGHFISLLYECRLISPPDNNLKFEKGISKPGEWTWHDKCPDDLISVHEIYRKFI